jgi:hypothetical protein
MGKEEQPSNTSHDKKWKGLQEMSEAIEEKQLG